MLASFYIVTTTGVICINADHIVIQMYTRHSWVWAESFSFKWLLKLIIVAYFCSLYVSVFFYRLCQHTGYYVKMQGEYLEFKLNYSWILVCFSTFYNTNIFHSVQDLQRHPEYERRIVLKMISIYSRIYSFTVLLDIYRGVFSIRLYCLLIITEVLVFCCNYKIYTWSVVLYFPYTMYLNSWLDKSNQLVSWNILHRSYDFVSWYYDAVNLKNMKIEIRILTFKSFNFNVPVCIRQIIKIKYKKDLFILYCVQYKVKNELQLSCRSMYMYLPTTSV